MSTRIWAATRKGVFTIEKSAGKWAIATTDFLGDNASFVLPDGRDGSVYVALDHGHFGCKLHRSPDGGKSWSPCTAPKYPEFPAGRAPELNPMSGKPIPWNLQLIWALEAGGSDQPGTIWCGTVPGALFRSDDSGQTWNIIRSLWEHPTRPGWFGGGLDWPGIHSICVDPRNSNHVTLGISCAGVWDTNDGGENWELIGRGLRAEYLPPEKQFEPLTQDPHRLVSCAGHPDAMWIQHHNGIFASGDGGKNWREITGVKPSVFGFAVAAHPTDAKTAWFVPAIKDERRIPQGGRVVATRTRDGGASFEILDRGLPDEHAYDLVFRHCLDVDNSGQILAMGSTTGSMWVSENQGDSWESVPAHLPPIYCVRFEK